MNVPGTLERPTLSTDGTAGPYIIVATDQLEPVRHELLAEGIPHVVDEDAVRLYGKPSLAVINLDHSADLKKIQDLLDRVSAALNSKTPHRKAPVKQEFELIIQGDPKAIAEFTNRIERELPGDWRRRADIEERLRKARARGPAAYCFSKHVAAVGRDVVVWLQGRGQREFYVSSVLPLQTQEPFHVDQYNAALNDFQETLIKALSEGLNIRVLGFPAPGEPSLENMLSAEAFRRLKSFSTTANKTNLHPLDLQRWHAFIIKAHRDNVLVDSDTLSSWLEDEGWPDTTRKYLMEVYETARAILSTYDEELVTR